MMKWEAIGGTIQANSQYHGDGVPFVWWITEKGKHLATLHATKELLSRPKHFRTVLEAMTFADNQEEDDAEVDRILKAHNDNLDRIRKRGGRIPKGV